MPVAELHDLKAVLAIANVAVELWPDGALREAACDGADLCGSDNDNGAADGSCRATADRRGDTPLHAAACNGALECVRLLLEAGTPADTRNARGWTAEELARWGRHGEAAKLLAEFRLHGTVAFDSVLFLATVAGHRLCKRLVADALAEQRGPGYDVLMRPGVDGGLSRSASRWCPSRATARACGPRRRFTPSDRAQRGFA